MWKKWLSESVCGVSLTFVVQPARCATAVVLFRLHPSQSFKSPCFQVRSVSTSIISAVWRDILRQWINVDRVFLCDGVGSHFIVALETLAEDALSCPIVCGHWFSGARPAVGARFTTPTDQWGQIHHAKLVQTRAIVLVPSLFRLFTGPTISVQVTECKLNWILVWLKQTEKTFCRVVLVRARKPTAICPPLLNLRI